MLIIAALFIIGAYLIGSIPTGVVLARKFSKEDIRREGSGNIGATNVARLLGKRLGALTFVGDMLKGFIPVASGVWCLRSLASPQADPVLAACLIGLAAIVGHMYSAFLGFEGGKGVSTAVGVFLGLEPAVIPALLAVFVAVAALGRYVSLASISAAAAMPALLAGLRSVKSVSFYVIGLSIIVCVLIVFKHRANIQRLLQGTEHKIGAAKKEPPPA